MLLIFVGCRVDLKALLGISAFSLDRLMEGDPHFLDAEKEDGHEHHHHHHVRRLRTRGAIQCKLSVLSAAWGDSGASLTVAVLCFMSWRCFHVVTDDHMFGMWMVT